MNVFLEGLSEMISPHKHIALVIDNAGWHMTGKLKVPANITLIPLPPYSPELNAMEQVWEWMKDRFLFNPCYKDYDAIVTRVCQAWNAFALNRSLVKSLCARSWLNIP